MSDVLLLNADGQPLSHVPLSAISWKVAVRLIFLDKVKPLKHYDDWVIRSQHLEMKVPSIVIKTKQSKFNKKLKYSRENVFLRDNYTCQLQITSKCKSRHGITDVDNLTLDHVVPKSMDGKTNWLNVCASCKACNNEKGADSSILPISTPYKPSYYDILSKRKNMPLVIRDADWQHYIDWPPELITIVPSKTHR